MNVSCSMFYCQFFLNLLWSCRCENSASQGKRTKIIGAKCVSSLIRHIPFSRVRCVSMNLIAFLPISFFLFLSLPLFCECFIPLHWFFSTLFISCFFSHNNCYTSHSLQLGISASESKNHDEIASHFTLSFLLMRYENAFLYCKQNIFIWCFIA